MQLDLSFMRKHPQWPLVKKILKTLQANGHRAYLAGGCVRDFLLGKLAADLDIATSALPQDIENLFPRTLSVGKAFGTIIVVENSLSIEVTTFRRDGPYQDGRHPNYVEFSNVKEDASRRDFTINSMFLEPFTGKLIDYFNGQGDLKDNLIKTVGDPYLRFSEDKLRLLRALRFASQLNYRIESRTNDALMDLAPEISVVSKERILVELSKLAEGPAAFLMWEEFFKTGLWQAFFKKIGEFPKWQDFVNYGHKGLLAWTLFMAYWQKKYNNWPWWEEFKQWPLPRGFKRVVEKSLLEAEIFMQTSSFFSKARALNSAQSLLSLDLWRYDLWKNQVSTTIIEKFIKEYLSHCDSQGHLPPPLVKGADLIEKGWRQGPEIKEALERAYEMQIMQRMQTKEEIINLL